MNENRILYVRSIGRTLSKAELTIYFQSRKQSGGGDISSIEQKGDEAVITFEDSDVVKNVGKRAHTINGTNVEVSFHPFIRETQTQETSGNQTCVVVIRGLSQNTTEDAILNYFENPRRSGGGPVEEVNIKGDLARIKFESVEVANRVVVREKHSLDGAKLDVSLELPDSSEENGKTIEVAGLAASTTPDSISNYFENKRRSGGGEVETVDLRREVGVAFVTFKDADVVNNVLQRDKHTLDGAILNVTASNATCGLSEKNATQESRTIEVIGLATTTTKDAIANFFENKRRSGGGEVERVDHTPELGCAVVTFVTAESARGVVNKKSITLDKAKLKVTLKQPVKELPIDTRRLMVKGLSEKTTSDRLRDYMEVVSGVDVLAVEFGEQGRALVTFNETYDSQAITQKIAKRRLEDKRLSIEQVPVCHCVQVTGLNKSNTAKDTVLYYFENRKNGGGDVTNVEINAKEGWALVYFEDPQVVTKVMSKSHHSLNGAQLEVRPHNPFLGKPVSQPDENEVKLVKNIPVDAQVMAFISERLKDDFIQLQTVHGVKITWDEGSSRIILTPVDRASADENRFAKACEAIASFLDTFFISTTHVLPEAWQAVLDNLMQNGNSTKEKVKVESLPQQHVIVLTGKKQDVEGIAEELQGLNATIERKLKLEASKTTAFLEIPRMRLQFLKDQEFENELETKHAETQVSIILDEEKVKIFGPADTLPKVCVAVYQAVANMKEINLEMSQNAITMLRGRQGQRFMKGQFTASNLPAALSFGVENKENVVVVMGINSDVAEKASKLVTKLVVEESLVLNEDQVQLEKSDKWRQLIEELTEKCILSLSFDRSNKKVCLAGTKEDIAFTLEKLKRFFKENTIVSNAVELPRGCRMFLAKYRERELRQIEEELKEHSTRIKEMAGEDDDDLVISGTTDGVDKGTKLIQDLASKVESRKVFINKPGMQKVLDRKKLPGLLENENKCVIEHFIPQKDGSKKLVEEEKEANKREKDSLCSFLTAEGKTIMVFKDNICDRNVEVIVNAANSNLHNVGDISKAIVEAAGDVVKDECERYIIDRGPILEGQVVVTSAGKLPFKKVIHAVGPRWGKKAAQEKLMGKAPREEKLLSHAVTKALEAAKYHRSIAIPAISTGVYEFPRELCAKIMVDSALAFCQENPNCCLSEIQFTSIDDDVVMAFVKKMDSSFLQDPNYQTYSDSKVKFSPRKGKGRNRSTLSPPAASVSPDISNVIETPEGLKLVLVTGDMSLEQVDSIVNSTSSELNLAKNASAKALSVAAGPKLQQECKTIGKVNTGDIVVTSGANLKCKHVFHTSCAAWENGKGEQVLRGIVKKCLNEAQKRNLSSIAIPAIGTGNLAFPHDRVAAASFDEVLTFSTTNPSSTLKEVHLVVYDKDLSSVQAFRTELQNRKGSQAGSAPPPVAGAPAAPAVAAAAKRGNKKRHGSRGATTKRSVSDASTGVHDTFEMVSDVLDPLKSEITIGSITVQVETGDITKEITDAIATLSNDRLDVAFGGGVGKAILNAGGPIIQAECSSLGSQVPGSIAVTGAGKLRTRKIYHMVPDYKISITSIKDCIGECLRKADSDGLTSISFPAVGTDNIQKGAKEAAEGMMAAISKFAYEQPTSLDLIRIVIYQPHMLQIFRSAMAVCIFSGEGGPGFFSKVAGWFGFGKGGSATSYPTESKNSLREKGNGYLEIFAGCKQDIDKAIEEIEKDVADHCKLKFIERNAISKLSKQQTRKIIALQEKHDAVVIIEAEIDRISIRGDAEDVLDVATTIHEILNQQMEEELTRGVEKLISQNTQWFYYGDDNSLVPYDSSVNLQIEKAFGDRQNSVIVLIDETRFEIVFNDMKETCLEDGEERVVIRKEIGKGVPLPNEWGLHPTDSSGKEKEVHLVPLDPVNDANEYKKVADEVRKTSSVTITKIERVQNPGLFRAYMVRKDQMDQNNDSNEKTLFHGTEESSCATINYRGFNRSYCGKNATVYGKGVYFARDASYSTQATYSPANAAGNRYMYLARVLAGEYTTGGHGMITPPPKGSDATDAYDTVVDNATSPRIFVVFYDNQCYPNYLITFK